MGRAAADGSVSQAGAIPIFVERLVNEVAPNVNIELAILPWKNVRGHRGTGFDRNPKGRLQRLIAASPAGSLSSGFSAHYAAIARQCDLAVLERCCASGFRGFAASVRELAFRLSQL